MPVDRKLWLREVIRFPHYVCPRCKTGRLSAVLQSETRETPTWVSLEDPSEWQLDYERFAILLECGIQQCGELVAASGKKITTGEIMTNPDTGADMQEQYYCIEAMTPAPPMFAVEPKTPLLVREDLNLAFAVFWIDQDLCASKLRSAGEKFLDHYKIPRSKIVNGERRFISFHNRIELLKNKKVDNVWLHGLRKVGNLGTHGGESGVDDEKVFDVMDLFEIILGEAFGDDKKRRATKLARQFGAKAKRPKTGPTSPTGP